MLKQKDALHTASVTSMNGAYFITNNQNPIKNYIILNHYKMVNSVYCYKQI
jgi:hypothetical protein